MERKLLEHVLLQALRRGTLDIEQQRQVCKVLKQLEYAYAIQIEQTEQLPF